MRREYSLSVRFEKRDAWVGLYWTIDTAWGPIGPGYVCKLLSVYICLVPFFPIRFRTWKWRRI